MYAPKSETSRYTYTKDPRPLTSFLVGMLWVFFWYYIIGILNDFGQMVLLSGAYTTSEEEANDFRQRLVAAGSIPVYVLTAVVFLRWKYCANLNSRGFGAWDMRFTPGWSVGFYFIPFLNLVRPYQAMKEIWQISHDPDNWQLVPGASLLGWWWALWLTSGFVGQLVFQTTLSAVTVDELRESTVLSMISRVIAMALGLVAIKLVKTISARQEALVNQG